MTPSIRILLAAALAFAGPAPATVYKYQRPDGSVVYADAPVAGARLLERFDLAQGSGPADRGSEQKARPQPARDPAAALEAADAEVRAAQTALDEAKARLQRGAEPLPGERTPTASGRTRLNEAYF